MSRDWRGYLTLPVFIIALLAVALAPTAAHSQTAAGTQSGALQAGVDPLDTSFIGLAVKRLAIQGYAIDGPSEVAKVEGSSITLYSGRKKDPAMNLAGMNVTVKDYQNRRLTLADIQPKMKIYTCRKQNDAIIYVLQKKEATNDN